MINGPNNKTIEEKNELYEKYKRLINKVLNDLHCNIKTLDQYEDYYEVAQLGLAKAINNIGGDWKNATSSYFYAYIKNEIINYFNYRSTPKRYLLGAKLADIDEWEIDSGVNLERDLIIKEQNEELYMAIFELKPLYREIIMDRFGLGGRRKKTIAEIADKEKISHQAVQQRQNYALNKLKKELMRRNDEQKRKITKPDYCEYFKLR